MRELFFDLLEVNIGASVVIMLICAFGGRLRDRYGAGWMKTLWLLLAIRLAIPYNASLPFMELRLLDNPDFAREAAADGEIGFDRRAQWEDVQGSMRAADGYTASQVPDGTALNVADMEGITEAGVSAGDGGSDNGASEPAESDLNKSALSESILQEGVWHKKHMSFDFVDILLVIWLAGMSLCLLCIFGSRLLFCMRYRKRMYPISDTDRKEKISAMQRYLIGRDSVPVYQCRRIASPMLTGVFRPRLVLPSVTESRSDEELELMLAHELCHYKKKDILLKLFVAAVWCVNWFNPTVWLLKKQFSYDMELACDESVLAACDEGKRETYARMLLRIAGGGKKMPVFTTGFTAGGRRMKTRIAHVMDGRAHKRGRTGILAACGMVLLISAVVSCGYRPEASSPVDRISAGTEPESLEWSQAKAGSKTETEFDYNHDYNETLRVYGEDLYLAREDGIYQISGGVGEEELVYANAYMLHRGMELYRNYLYFCGSAQRGDMDAATIYRMDLDSLEVTDALAAFGNVFTGLHQISIYEDRLYVATDYAGHRIGFILQPDGMVGAPLDETAEDFPYRETNAYADLTLRLVRESSMWEIERLKNVQNEMYQAVLDVVSCRRLLHGRLLVSRYNPNDDLARCLYLEDEVGDYEYLCDIREWPVLVVEDGIYYVAMDGGIRYMDFADRQERRLWSQTREWSQLSLLTYDASYIYFVKSRPVGFDAEDVAVSENYLMRIPRQGGEAERIYRFENGMDSFLPDDFCGNCSVYADKMYIQGHSAIVLDPKQNGMQGLNNGERSADFLALEQAAEMFAQAYFQNDAEAIRQMLTEDFSWTVDLYEHPEHAQQIERLYLGGLPEGEAETGMSIWLSYEFREYGADVRTYLSMKFVKTPQGWRVDFYGLER